MPLARSTGIQGLSARFPAAASIAVVAALAGLAALPAGASGAEPPEIPADVRVRVVPEPAAAGAAAAVELTVEPRPGIRINRYPRIRLVVEDHPGLTAGGRAERGADRPPGHDEDPDDNYYAGPADPLRLELPVDGDATPGAYEVTGRLRYFYCVKQSGFCAPKEVDVTIPLRVR